MHSSIADAFLELLRADPQAVIAWTASGMRTRRDLDIAAEDVAARLDEVAPGSRVGLCVRDGFTFLAAFLALARRTHTAILLDAADPRAPRLDLAARFGARAVIVDTPNLMVLACAAAPSAVGSQAVRPSSLGPWRAIKLTSGSTGEPNAIGVGDAELLADASALEESMGIGDEDRVFAAVPMSFSYGVGNLLVPALARGRCLVLPKSGALGLLHAMRSGQPTVLPAVPALLRGLLQGSFELPASMRLVMSAGAVLSRDLAVAFRRRFALSVHAFYGSTESGGVSYDRTGTAAERGSVGTPVNGVLVALRHDGRVQIRSAAVGQALDGSGNPAHGQFVAADFGAMVHGELTLQGRVGSVFDVGGHKVDPREIERLIRELPEVCDVEVLPFEDEHNRSVCAAVVAAHGLSEQDVRRHCAKSLPAAKVPRRLVVVDELPRTSRGKLSRVELGRLLMENTSTGLHRPAGAAADHGSQA